MVPYYGTIWYHHGRWHQVDVIYQAPVYHRDLQLYGIADFILRREVNGTVEYTIWDTKLSSHAQGRLMNFGRICVSRYTVSDNSTSTYFNILKQVDRCSQSQMLKQIAETPIALT